MKPKPAWSSEVQSLALRWTVPRGFPTRRSRGKIVASSGALVPGQLTMSESQGGCWGGIIKGDDGKNCHRDFIRGRRHMKNKFCVYCTAGDLYVAASTVRGLPDALHEVSIPLPPPRPAPSLPPLHSCSSAPSYWSDPSSPARRW